MGQQVNRASKEKVPIKLTSEEVKMYIKRFQIIDKDNKGYVSINDIRRALKVLFRTVFYYLTNSSLFSITELRRRRCFRRTATRNLKRD